MDDIEFIYTHQKLNCLKAHYSIFYYSLKDYLDTFDEKWSIREVYNPDGDGTRFSIICKNFKKETMTIYAIKDHGKYTFSYELVG